MPTQDDTQQPRLTRRQVAAAVDRTGWRLLSGSLVTAVAVSDAADAGRLVAAVLAACGHRADGHLHIELSDDVVVLTLQTSGQAGVTPADIELLATIGDAVVAQGFRCEAAVAGRGVQLVELAIDAMDIPRVQSFWRAVLGYRDEAGNPENSVALVDPLGHGPSIWFQQLDRPREQRNRIHFDVMVGQDEADSRVAAAVAAGGTLVSDARARAFWVLADPEGNEICVCTWQDREK